MKKQKLLSLLLVLVMLVTCSVNTSTEVLAVSGNPTITVGTAEGNPGDEVTVTVSMSNNPGICSARLAVSYDSKLTLTAAENGSVMSDNVFGKKLTANPYYVTWDESTEDSDNTNNGTLVTLKFKISDFAIAGDYPVSISYRSGEIYNLNLTDIDFDVVNGKVTVKSASTPDPVPVESITLNEAKTDFDKGNTFQLTANVLPNNATDKSITWTSNDESIATVDANGLVTGVKNGTTTITATSKDGKVQTSCTVTVNCIHDQRTTYTEKESTCKEQGNDKYYVCDDCGKIFAEDGVTELEAAPFRPLGDHKGGTATCKAKAVCSVCGLSYGDYGSHRYTAQIKTQETLKALGTCKDEAIYYYSCSVCGECEHNDSHTFLGEKDSHAHTGETEIKDAKEATCCEDGYTGDTYCKGCNTKIESGSVIPATGNHTDADGKWETDGAKHWHTCYHSTTFDEAEHSGGNATCKQKAVCKDCGVEYGDYAAHQLTKHDRVEPTFENDGNIEYWTCNECGKYFSDAEGKNEINAQDTVIGKLTIKKLTYLDGEVLIEVPSNAVSGEFEITVDKIVPPPAEIVEKVKDTYGESSEVLAYYEIRLFDENGARIYNLNNEITIKSKLPEKYQTGYVIKMNQEDDNGNLVEMQSWREGEYICYKTDWLEKY